MSFPSDFQTLQNEVINKLRLDSTNDLSKVKDWINRVYYRVVSETGASVTSTTLNMVAATKTYTLSSSTERVLGAYITPVNGSASAPLIPTTLDDLIRKRQASGGNATEQGQVTHYALLGVNTLEVWPTPASADVVTLYYAALPTALSANADIPILHEPWSTDLLTYGALAEAADFLNHPSEPEYRAIFEDYTRRYRAHLARKGPKPDQLVVGGDYVYPPHDPSTDVR